MTTLTFDTLKYANKLKAANVPPEQAEATVEIMSEAFEINLKDLATKEDLHREIGGLRKDLLREMKELELRMTIRLSSVIILSLGAFTALPKIFGW